MQVLAMVINTDKVALLSPPATDTFLSLLPDSQVTFLWNEK